MHAQHIEFLELLNGQQQYVVPRWQRRYSWGQDDIKRLVEDLWIVGRAGTTATHYGGTLLTFPEPGAAGVVKTIRVVDGQQRLTTVSILLACIAAKLGHSGRCGGWTAEIIHEDRLTNPKKSPELRRKLRLQNGDEEEYRRIIEGNPTGAGAVTQAWRIVRRLVADRDVGILLQGLERLRVVSIGLSESDDPQQIFESLNATGRPLTESEKVKNWLLMGLPDAEQQDLHDNHWLRIEQLLDAKHTTEPIDMFLRDLLRWRTGQTRGIRHVYHEFRKWAAKSGQDQDRPVLCRDLTRLAGLYGLITGTAGLYGSARVDRELRHLREMQIDVQRPLLLRLLNDADENDCGGDGIVALEKTLSCIGAWTTRMWLADRTFAGLNKAAAEIAYEPGPDEGEDFTEHWLGRIRRLRNTRVGVPGDEHVREGIRTRKAYGGSATRSAFAVLCELMEAEHREEAPARNRLTIEHVMPQKLTEEWRLYLGGATESIHGQYRDRLANLTLSGDATNAGMGSNSFAAKRKVYRNSPVGLTRRLAEESKWDETAIERRAESLVCRVLKRWPWTDQEAVDAAQGYRWRIENGPWHAETFVSQMVLNVAAAILDSDPANAARLARELSYFEMHSAERYPADSKIRARGRAVPRHEKCVLYPYVGRYVAIERCRKMGELCGVRIEVEAGYDENDMPHAFWKFLKEKTGGVPGQKDTWRGGSQWVGPVNTMGDRIAISVGNPEFLRACIMGPVDENSKEMAARMRSCSLMIRDLMGDQQILGDLEQNSVKGASIYVQRPWVRDDEGTWPDAAQWIKWQFKRLKEIAASQSREKP